MAILLHDKYFLLSMKKIRAIIKRLKIPGNFFLVSIDNVTTKIVLIQRLLIELDGKVITDFSNTERAISILD